MITRCKNGHWYDSGVNRACPHCKQESEKLSIRLNDIEEDDRTVSIIETELSLGEELGAIIGNSIEHTMSVSQGNSFDDDDKTISFGFFGMTAIKPVAGWLVCMNGSEKGKDYRLHAGKNFIGRSASMDVMLIEDKSISRDRHCSVVYDPKGNVFFLSSEGGNTVYLDDKLVNSPKELKEGSLIMIGQTKLMFIPFCREGRIWEDE